MKQGLEGSLRQMRPLYEAARADEKNTRVIDRAMAGIYKQAAETLVSIGRVSEAAKPFAEMDRISESLATKYGAEDDNFLVTLAIGKGALGRYQFYSLGDMEAAEGNYQKSLRLYRDQLAKAPEDGGRLRSVANALGALATTMLRRGRTGEARTYFDEEVRVRESIPEPLRSVFEVRRELSGLHAKLGHICLSQGDLDGARQHLQRSFEIREELAEDGPDNAANRRDIYRSYEDFGHIALLQLNDPKTARTYYQKAVDGFTAHLPLDPESAIYRGDVATAHYFLATALLRLGENDASMKSYRLCRDMRRELAKDPKALTSRIDLMLALARCGEHAEAALIARSTIKKLPANAAGSYVEFACGLAICAGAAEKLDPESARAYADEAIAAIRRGSQGGWRDVERLKVDPDLDAIRSRPDFQQLIKELAAPPAGGKRG